MLATARVTGDSGAPKLGFAVICSAENFDIALGTILADTIGLSGAQWVNIVVYILKMHKIQISLFNLKHDYLKLELFII